MMCLEQTENCFVLILEFLLKNNVKYIIFVTVLTFVTLQGSVHTYVSG